MKIYFRITCVQSVCITLFQSLLINGRGKYDCANLSASVCNATNPECAPASFTVVPGKTYRFRVASLTSLSALSFQIEVNLLIFLLSQNNKFKKYKKSDNLHFSRDTT